MGGFFFSSVVIGNFFFGNVKISVFNGKGVNYTNLLRLGERFFRIDSSHKESVKGSGLGLAIVKHALKFLRGSAIIRSSLGNGFTFSFIIPVGTVKQNLTRG